MIKIKKYFQSQMLLHHDNIKENFIYFCNLEKRFKKYNIINYSDSFSCRFQNNLLHVSTFSTD